MTPPELSTEKDHFSTPFITSEEDFYTDLTLETYLEALSHNEAWTPAFDEIETGSAKRRDRLLDRAVRKLAVTEFQGKEYVEEYVRCQYRSNCSPHTIKNSYQVMESFIGYLIGVRKKSLEEFEKRDVEGFVEQAQNRGMQVSTESTTGLDFTIPRSARNLCGWMRLPHPGNVGLVSPFGTCLLFFLVFLRFLFPNL